jgi:UDP-glucose 4-epimerase
MKKVIVTGGAGFIGSHTSIELSKAGYLPVVIDNFCASERAMLGRLRQLIGHDFPVYEFDCRDPKALAGVFAEQGPIFGVIHFAAHKAVGVSVDKPLDYYDNNVGSLLVLLRAMFEANVSNFVFSSSCTVYGQPDTLPVTEASAIKPAESPYGRTKQVCESVIEDVVRSKAPLKAVTLRYFNPVGAHPSALIGELPIGRPENLVPYITQTAAGLRDQLTVFGDDYPTADGTCVRDYIHVVDLAKAHVRALDWLGRQPEGAANEVINVGTGRGTTVLQAIQAFEEASGQKLNYRVGPRRTGDVVETYASVDKAAEVLGFRTELTILDAMRDAHRWQLALRDNPLPKE